jgi:hypothetical protein
VGLRLKAAGLGDRSMLLTDETMTAKDMEALFGSPTPLRRSDGLGR